jgi:hypothetical protein
VSERGASFSEGSQFSLSCASGKSSIELGRVSGTGRGTECKDWAD